MSFFRRTKQYVMLFVAAIVTSGYSQSTITFNVGGATTVVNKEVFGLLMERLGRQWTNNGIFVGTGSTIPNTNGMRNDVIDGFKECGVGAAQWPGGCAANGYRWSDNKKPQNDVGVDRFIQFCKLTGAEAVISGMPTGGDDASNLAFAQYIIDSLQYPLKWFKIGNEIWGGCGGSTYTNGYTAGFTSNYDLLKTLKNTPNGKDLKFIAAAGAIEGGYNWIPTYYSAIGSIMNAVEIHDYIYRTTWSSDNPTTDNYWQIMNDIFVGDIHDHMYNNIFPAMNTADPSKRVKVCLDEWGDWLKADGNWMQTITVMDAISAGGHLNQFIQNADRVGVACLAQGVNVIHSIINIDLNGVMVKTPAFYVFKMYKPHHKNNAKFLPMTASNFEKANGTVPALSAAASVDDSGFVNISFTNCDISATRNVTVTLTSSKASYTIKSAEVITGPAINTTNPFGGPEQVNIQTLEASAYSVNGKTLSVTLPSKSVVMVRLDTPPPTSVLQPVQLQNNGADAFSIKAGSRGGVQITSTANRKTPVTISLYGIDGRTLIGSTTRTLEAGNSVCVFENSVKSRGVYLVKITGDNLDLTKQVVIAK